jgi:hypothetical protein
MTTKFIRIDFKKSIDANTILLHLTGLLRLMDNVDNAYEATPETPKDKGPKWHNVLEEHPEHSKEYLLRIDPQQRVHNRTLKPFYSKGTFNIHTSKWCNPFEGNRVIENVTHFMEIR